MNFFYHCLNLLICIFNDKVILFRFNKVCYKKKNTLTNPIKINIILYYYTKMIPYIFFIIIDYIIKITDTGPKPNLDAHHQLFHWNIPFPREINKKRQVCMITGSRNIVLYHGYEYYYDIIINYCCQNDSFRWSSC